MKGNGLRINNQIKNIMNWYINQDIVCIKTHSKGYVKEGRVYTIKGLKRCKCGVVNIDIGVSNGVGNIQCTPCGNWFKTLGEFYFSEHLFAPLEYDKQAIEELLTIKEKV